MTKYYLFTEQELAAHPGIEEERFHPDLLQVAMEKGAAGTKLIILQSFRIATKGEAPILFDTPLPPPPPKKRGRPPKPKEKAPSPLERPIAGFPPRPASLLIESCVAPQEADQDGLYRATILGIDGGVEFTRTGVGESRQKAVESAMDLAALSEADVKRSPNTPGKKALLEAWLK